MANIKAIDKATVHKICSGQVVLTLAVAIKELVENSLDAGATVIEVKLKDYGSEQVEVSDNGSGIHPSNFQALTLKHHTSKIQEFSDLISVGTFGFRGEALSSLCALSEVSVITRHSSQNCGTALNFNREGQIIGEKQHARQVGTTVILKSLFSSLPVRQKEFHKNLKREFNKMTQLLNAYCLVSIGVRFTCINQTSKGSRVTFISTSGCKSVKENISCLFGAKQVSSLLDLKQCYPTEEALSELKATEDDCDRISFEGYVSSCAHGAGRATTDRQFYFINSRPCDPSKIIKEINEVYHEYNVHQYPFVFLNIKVAEGTVDVNVTPDKRQVFLSHEKLLLSILKASLTETYKKIPSTFSLNSISSVSKLPSKMQEPNSRPNFKQFEAWKHKSDVKRNSDSSNEESPMKKKKKMDDVEKIYLDKFILKKDTIKRPLIEKESLSSDQNDKVANLRNIVQSSINIEDSRVKEPVCNDETELVKITNESESFNKHSSKPDRHSITNSSINVLSNNAVEKEINVVSQSEDSSIKHEVFENCDTKNYLTKAKESRNDLTSLLVGKEQVQETEHPPEESINSLVHENAQENDPKCVKIVCDNEWNEARPVIYSEIDLDGVRKRLSNRLLIQDDPSKSAVPRFRATINPNENSQAEKELSKEISKETFEKMEIVGQFNLGFIIAKLESDLFIIDQHATDEKYNFETLQKNTIIGNQKLVNPQPLELTAVNEAILIDNIEIFLKNGFEFIIDENAPPTKKVNLTAKPISKDWVFGKDDIDELIFMLEDSKGADCRPSRVRAMFASRACRKSVMIGTALSNADMRRLINNMGLIDQPWNCPHGRPTIRHLVNLSLISTASLSS